MLVSLLCQLLIHPHQLRNALGFCVQPAPESVGLHDGFVVLLVGFAEFGGHSDLIIEVGKGAIGVQRPCIEDGLFG